MKNRDQYFIFTGNESFNQGYKRGVSVKENRLALLSGSNTGLWMSPVLEGVSCGHKWQRLRLGFVCPDDAKIVCYTYACESASEMEEMLIRWENERVANRERRREFTNGVKTIVNAKDALLTGLCGRYLIIMIEMYRQGKESPKIDFVQVYSQQESFLGYLPEIFQREDSFLDRYLRLFSVQYLEMEEKISRLSDSFHPYAASEPMLHMLANAIGTPNIHLWNSKQLRELLFRGTYRRKGTKGGMVEILKLYTGYEPYIIEKFLINQDIDLKDEVYGGGSVIILIPPQVVKDSEMADALHLIIKSMLAQEISYTLIFLENIGKLSDYAFFDLNACLEG